MKIKNLLITTVLATVLLFSSISVSAMTEQERQSLINQLLQQIAQLQTQIAEIIAQQQGTTPPASTPTTPTTTPSDSWCHNFNTNIRYYATGPEVSALHTALEKQGFTISASELSSATYLDSTTYAVNTFQERYASEILRPHGLTRGTGFAGPSTRAKLNQLYGCQTTTPTACAQDVRQCPDGSWVSRVPPDCNFAPCPTETTPQCTENNWIPTLSPTTCPSSGQQTRTWTKIGNCQGGVAKPASEIVSCSSVPTVDIKANGSDKLLTVPFGAQVEVTWSYSNSFVCDFSEDLLMFDAYPKPNGRIIVESVTREYVFTITCKNSAGITTDTVLVNKQQEVYTPVKVDIKANGSDGPISVAYENPQVELTWFSENASYCYASGDWTSLSVPANGQKIIDLSKIGMIGQGQYSFTIFCENILGTVKDTVVVSRQLQTFNPVTIDIKANGSDGPISVAYENPQVELTWFSENATQGCWASGDWDASGRSVNGQMTIDLSKMWAIKSQYSFTITCMNPRGTATDTVTVSRLPQVFAPIKVDIKANGSDGPISVGRDDLFELTWSSENASYCYASGDWLVTGGGLNGQKTLKLSDVWISKSQYSFTINCRNQGGEKADTVIVNRL